MPRFPLIIFVFAVCCNLCGNNLLPHMRISRTGVIDLDGVNIRTVFFGPKWRGYRDQNWQVVKNSPGSPVIKNDRWELKGRFFTTNSAFEIVEKIKVNSPGSVNYYVCYKNSKGIEAEALALAAGMPTTAFSGRKITMDASTITLPIVFKKEQIISYKKVSKISIPASSGVITFEAAKGKLAVLIQDERAFGGKSYTLRIFFDKFKGLITDSPLTLNIKYRPYKSTPVPLTSVANMDFKDEVAGDKKGGWTDQGQNDLRQFKTGKKILGGVAFDIIQAEKNNGKSCVVLAGPQREYFPQQVKVNAFGKKGKFLYLLHAIAWAPARKTSIGKLKVDYKDGTSQSTAVQCGVDVGNWWQPFPLKNGSVAWTADNKNSYIGLYMSKFPVADKPINNISLTSSKKAVWMIAGISVGEDIPLGKTPNYYVVKGSKWQPFKHAVSVEPGSILDFSDLLDAPAGKYGKVVIRNGQFEFEQKPGIKQLFYGTNLCFSANYQSKEQTEKVVADLVRMGYNTIRIHHYDRGLRDKSSSFVNALNTQRLDQLDYLFYQLKKNGIYVAIDLYTIRPTVPGELKSLSKKVLALQEYKMYAALEDEVFENWKKFASTLLNHVNPYTGMKWKDDSALFNICLLNENNINAHWATTTDSQKLYQKVFASWLKNKNIVAANEIQRGKLFNEFVIELQTKLLIKCRNFVRSLGGKAYLTDMNMQSYIPLQLVRDHMDYVDNHIYWDHPRYLGKRGKWPCGYKNRSSMLDFAFAPRTIMPTRIFGKPFSVSEYNFCAPNPYRGESGPLTAAYAALQGWDVIHRFAYSHWYKNLHTPKPVSRFDIVTDPVSLLSDRIAVLLFRKSELKEAKTVIPFALSKGSLDNIDAFRWRKGEAPPEYSKLGLMVKVGSVIVSKQKKLPVTFKCAVGVESLPADMFSGKPYFKVNSKLYNTLETKGLLPAGLVNSQKTTFNSETGQISLNQSQKFFRVISNLSECFVIDGKRQIAGKQVSVKNNNDFAVVFVGSRDNRPLQNSQKMLLFHLTDVKNTKAKFRDSNHSILLDPGKLPHLVRRGSVEITLKNIAADKLKVWRVNMQGKRIGLVKTQRKGNTISFKAETIRKDGTFMIYEVSTK